MDFEKIDVVDAADAANEDVLYDFVAEDEAAMARLAELQDAGTDDVEIARIMEEEYPDFMDMLRSLVVVTGPDEATLEDAPVAS